MPEPKPYPQTFACERCENIIGIENEDSRRIVSLWVLVTPRDKGITLEELSLTLQDFRVKALGHGGIVCSCGYVTQWYANERLLKRLVTDRYKKRAK